MVSEDLLETPYPRRSPQKKAGPSFSCENAEDPNTLVGRAAMHTLNDSASCEGALPARCPHDPGGLATCRAPYDEAPLLSLLTDRSA